MVMPASDALISICQAQLSLLEKSLAVQSAIVYLTESWTEPGTEGTIPGLYPVAVIPDPMRDDRSGSPLPLAPSGSAGEKTDSTLDSTLEMTGTMDARSEGDRESSTREFGPSPYGPSPYGPSSSPRTPGHQLVLPLVHEELVLGVLVAERSRAMDAQEQPQMDAIRQTLTLACVMDRRSQWLDAQQQEQRVLHRQQKDLMDNLLHQFRNPLTAMRTFGKLLMKRMVETDGNREVASSIVRESDRLQGLLVQFEAAVDLTEDRAEQAALAPGLLSLPESSSLGRELTIETLDILTVITPAVRSARAMTDDRNQKLKAILPETPLWVQGDVSALGEVFSNLLDNASKYTPPNGEIQVNLEVRSDKLHVHITDNGYGIPPEDLPRLFERHFRGVMAESAIPGTGLGLAIVRDLLHHMGGDIEVSSPPLGCDRGTMARITLSKTPSNP
jgi:signal transduction histidine kinase